MQSLFSHLHVSQRAKLNRISAHFCTTETQRTGDSSYKIPSSNCLTAGSYGRTFMVSGGWILTLAILWLFIQQVKMSICPTLFASSHEPARHSRFCQYPQCVPASVSHLVPSQVSLPRISCFLLARPSGRHSHSDPAFCLPALSLTSWILPAYLSPFGPVCQIQLIQLLLCCWALAACITAKHSFVFTQSTEPVSTRLKAQPSRLLPDLCISDVSPVIGKVLDIEEKHNWANSKISIQMLS